MLNKDSVKWMQQGLHYHQRANFAQAQICYENSLASQADNYETLQLFGALMHKLGNNELAQRYLLKSLSINPKQAHVINTLGNVYKASQDAEKAIQSYHQAIQTKPDYLDPYLNLGYVLLDAGQFEEFDKLIIKGKRYFSENCRFITLYAKRFYRQANYKKAIELLEKAIQIGPNQVEPLHDLGVVYRLTGNSSAALKCYEKVESLGHESAAFYHNYGNALSDFSASKQALEYYSKALKLNPLARDTLQNWCDLMWETGQKTYMFAAYDQLLKAGTASPDILLDYLQKCIRVNQLKLAQELCINMQKRFPHSNLVALAKLLVQRYKQDYTIDIKQFRKVVNDASIALSYKIELLEFSLEAGLFEISYEHISALLEEHANDQHLLALLHTCSRLFPERNYPFKQVERYLFEYRIEPPSNMSLESYLDELKATLLKLHSSEEQPLEQTLHKGTQTRGNLFDLDHPHIEHIKEQYFLAVEAYKSNLSQLPELYDGFWQHKRPAFSGSWSVALKQSGYHNNHIHPMGWLSSAFYVSLPDVSNITNQGYFQIGVPNLADKGLGLKPLKEVKPELGKLLLFPSMLWHGTVPFTEDSLRLSIACDIIYSNENSAF